MKINGSSALRIRRARLADAPALAVLCGQLGYPASPQQMVARLKEALRVKTGACFVAEASEGAVIGWVHISVKPLLEVDRLAEIDGIIVDERARSGGVGARLLREAEKWASKMRCTGMSVRSNVLRERAHQFYLREGYRHYKTQKTFRKGL
jgi:N-acetylglutamate synthase-like GNAT family acetyltransferase